MENKKDLAKIALTALILASATPVIGHADIEAQGIVLAAGCPAHGCAHTSGSNANAQSSGNFYNAPNQNGRVYNSQPYGRNNSASMDQPQGDYADYQNLNDNRLGGPSPDYRNQASGNYNQPSGNYYNSYESNSRSAYMQPGASAPTYTEDSRGTSYSSASRSSEYGMAGYNRGNAPEANYDNSFSTEASSPASATLTEAQLLGMLNPQGRALYQSLDPEAKALAIQLASQDSYKNKELAVKEAQRRMNERRSSLR